MSKRTPDRAALRVRGNAPLFAALGDETRLTLLVKLGDGSLLSITRLTEGTSMSRQAITKHLRVLQAAGLVRNVRRGRETLFQMDREPLSKAQVALNVISRQWDDALARLKAHVEE